MIENPTQITREQQTIASNCTTIRNDIVRRLYLSGAIEDNDASQVICEICGMSADLHFNTPICPFNMTYAHYMAVAYGYEHCPVCMHIPIDHYGNSEYEMTPEYFHQWRQGHLPAATFINTKYSRLLKLFHAKTKRYFKTLPTCLVKINTDDERILVLPYNMPVLQGTRRRT